MAKTKKRSAPIDRLVRACIRAMDRYGNHAAWLMQYRGPSRMRIAADEFYATRLFEKTAKQILREVRRG